MKNFQINIDLEMFNLKQKLKPLHQSKGRQIKAMQEIGLSPEIMDEICNTQSIIRKGRERNVTIYYKGNALTTCKHCGKLHDKLYSPPTGYMVYCDYCDYTNSPGRKSFPNYCIQLAEDPERPEPQSKPPSQKPSISLIGLMNKSN